MKNFEIRNNKKEYDKEQDELLFSILDNRFFKGWNRNNYSNWGKARDLAPVSSIELFITSTCNQKCEYCYLVKYKELYPDCINEKDKIFDNLKIFLKWIKKNSWQIQNIDLFSGEIWHNSFGFNILQILYDFCKENPKTIFNFTIPSNGTFLLKDETFFKIQNFIDDFAKIGVRLCFSLSIDGKIIENQNRPLNSNQEKDDNFFDKAFLFAQHNGFSFHPMVSAKSSKYWIENYKWWKEKCKEYSLNVYQIMMLEVRNGDWTQENIIDYNNFINYLLQDLYNDCKKNIPLMAKALFNFPLDEKEKFIDLSKSNYLPYTLPLNTNYPGCTICTHLCIRLGDLAILPCHRTGYSQNIYGFLEINEKKEIVHIKANNPYLAGRILLGNNILCSPKCDSCIYNRVCLKGCYGAQMEYNRDPFMPIPYVCNFFEAKINNLVQQYYKYGIVDYLKSVLEKGNPQYLQIIDIIDFCEQVKENVLD